MRGRPITPGMVRISRRCYDVLQLSWPHIGRLMDRDPSALRRAASTPSAYVRGYVEKPVYFNPKSQ